MIKAELDKTKGILHARPSGPLEAADFDRLSALADPYIAQKGELAGIMIEVKEFPGWKNLSGMVRHFKFVRNHHRKIRRVALVTNARIGSIAEKFARHFVAAEVKRFPAEHVGEAKRWISEKAK
jgi:hypothetical protein